MLLNKKCSSSKGKASDLEDEKENEGVRSRKTTIQRTINHIRYSKLSTFCDNSADRDKLIDEVVTAYHSPEATEEDKEHYRSIVVYNMYFLLLKVMERYKFPQFLFEDAIQNSVYEVLVALDKVDLSKKTKFSAYIQQYLKAAACITAGSISSIKTPYTARKKTMALINNYYSNKGISVSSDELDEVKNSAVAIRRNRETNSHYDDTPAQEDDYSNADITSSIDTQFREETIDPLSADGGGSIRDLKQEDLSGESLTRPNSDHLAEVSVCKLPSYNEVDLSLAGSSIEQCRDSIDIEEVTITKEFIDILAKVLQVLPSADTGNTRRKCNVNGEVIIKNVEDTYLTDKEKVVIIHRFGIFGAPQMTLREISSFFTVKGWKASGPRVLQIQQAALSKLKSYMDLNKITYLRS